MLAYHVHICNLVSSSSWSKLEWCDHNANYTLSNFALQSHIPKFPALLHHHSKWGTHARNSISKLGISLKKLKIFDSLIPVLWRLSFCCVFKTKELIFWELCNFCFIEDNSFHSCFVIWPEYVLLSSAVHQLQNQKSKLSHCYFIVWAKHNCFHTLFICTHLDRHWSEYLIV